MNLHSSTWTVVAPWPNVVGMDATEPPGQRLKRLRKKRGLTLEQLADMIGTWPGQLSKMESGERTISIGTPDSWAERIAPALDVDPYVFATDAKVPISKVAGSAFTDMPDPATLGRIALPPGVNDAEAHFAVLVGDDSADLLYPPGSVLICRRVDDGDELKPGTKIVMENYTDSIDDGTPMETLAGLLDVTVGGDVTLALRTDNRNLPASILIRRAEQNGLADRARRFADKRPEVLTVETHPTDRARILGRVVWAVTPEI